MFCADKPLSWIAMTGAFFLLFAISAGCVHRFYIKTLLAKYAQGMNPDTGTSLKKWWSTPYRERLYQWCNTGTNPMKMSYVVWVCYWISVLYYPLVHPVGNRHELLIFGLIAAMTVVGWLIPRAIARRRLPVTTPILLLIALMGTTFLLKRECMDASALIYMAASLTAAGFLTAAGPIWQKLAAYEKAA